jgi:hypothetical protein
VVTVTDDTRVRIDQVRERLHAGNLPGNAPELRWLAGEAERLADEVDRLSGELAELTEARRHGAYVMCGHGIATVTMASFGRKISEKRNALAQRQEAVDEANRARAAEHTALQRVAELEGVISWDTTCGNCAKLLDSSYAETSRAETAEATVARVKAVARPERDHRFPAEYYDGWSDALAAVNDALDEETPA